MTTKAPPKVVSPDAISRPDVTVEYERMALERLPAMVPAAFKALRKRAPVELDRDPNHSRFVAANHSRYDADVRYFPLTVPRTNLPIQQWPVVVPPLFPACVTTILAPPYLFASDEKTETGALIGPLSYSRARKEEGTIELMAQVLGTDTDAPLYDDLYRGRIAAGYLLAGVYTVPASSGAVELAISASVKAVGASLIFENAPGSLAAVQLSARMDIIRVGGARTSIPNNLHCHTWFPPVSVTKEIAADEVLRALIPAAEGDQFAIFLYAEARLIVQDGEDIIAVLNVSSDQSVISRGSVSFPYVTIRLC